jgi:hypothetical protein
VSVMRFSLSNERATHLGLPKVKTLELSAIGDAPAQRQRQPETAIR